METAQVLRVLLTVASSLLVVLTLLPRSRKGYWWIRVWDFPRAQIAVAGLLVTLGFVLLGAKHPRDTVPLAVLHACMLYQFSKIIPYTWLYRRQVLRQRKHDHARGIRLMAANILQDNRRVDKFLKVVRRADPDILCVVETDAWWEQKLRVLEQDYPHVNKCPLENTYGMLLYSRLPLRSTKLLFRVEDDIPSMVSEVELASGDVVLLHCLHPRPPLPFEDTFERDAELILVGREVKASDRPCIVMGDLNDVAWSYTTKLFQKLSGTLDPRIGRGMYNTFHANYPFLRYPLDHVFHTPHFTLVKLRRLRHVGSDHFPIFAELYFQPRSEDRQPAPVATQEDHEAAQEMLQDAAERAEERDQTAPAQPQGVAKQT